MIINMELADILEDNNSEQTEWFEQLPEQCPPVDAQPCSGCFYRIAKGIPTGSEDYFSQRKLQPEKIFVGEGIDECIVRSVSLFASAEEARKRLRLPKFRNNIIVAVDLSPKDGVIKKTFGPHHYSWWRTKSFNYTQIREAK